MSTVKVNKNRTKFILGVLSDYTVRVNIFYMDLLAAENSTNK